MINHMVGINIFRFINLINNMNSQNKQKRCFGQRYDSLRHILKHQCTYEVKEISNHKTSDVCRHP